MSQVVQHIDIRQERWSDAAWAQIVDVPVPFVKDIAQEHVSERTGGGRLRSISLRNSRTFPGEQIVDVAVSQIMANRGLTQFVPCYRSCRTLEVYIAGREGRPSGHVDHGSCPGAHFRTHQKNLPINAIARRGAKCWNTSSCASERLWHVICMRTLRLGGATSLPLPGLAESRQGQNPVAWEALPSSTGCALMWTYFCEQPHWVDTDTNDQGLMARPSLTWSWVGGGRAQA